MICGTKINGDMELYQRLQRLAFAAGYDWPHPVTGESASNKVYIDYNADRIGINTKTKKIRFSNTRDSEIVLVPLDELEKLLKHKHSDILLDLVEDCDEEDS